MSRIIAIIGRPNVGKSTLFNRIVGGRDAIVDDAPGVTRDRKYGTAEWAGKSFTLIDTGGYVPQSSDVFELAIREQAEIAIEEADAVIFVVDATAGIHPLDEEIASVLRLSEKKVHLVVNKVDSAGRDGDAAPFFRFGLGEPVPLSALGGRKIGDFLDDLTGGISVTESGEAGEERLRLAVVGRPNVGKSTLINALLGHERNIVTDIPGTTRDSIDSVLLYKGEELILIDTAGIRRRSRVRESVEFYSAMRTLKTLDRCNIAVQLVDGLEGVDRQDLRITEEICRRKRGAVLAVNKWDSVEKDAKTAARYERAIAGLLRQFDYIPVLFISALRKQRIFKVVSTAHVVHGQYTRRIPTNTLNRKILADIERRPPASSSGREVKINYITQIRTAPPLFAFFSNDPRKIRPDYRRFLENRIREHFGFSGVPLSLTFRQKHR